MVAMEQNIVYSLWSDKSKNKRRLTMPVEDVIAEITKKQIYRWKKSIELQIMAEKDGIDYLMPNARYWFMPNN